MSKIAQMNKIAVAPTNAFDAPPVTNLLARFVSSHPSKGWDESVERAARRTLLNWLGCAIGAARHPTVEAALAATNVMQPTPQATILGRIERVDIASAALINGISSHTFDFDDTHLRTIIHPAGPVASAALSLAEHEHYSGRQLLDAIVLGIDVACRIGNAIYPEHYDRGWHITGTTGGVGAAAACSRLLGLDEHRTQMAIAIAASQPVGVRVQFGSMTKPLHPGAAARVGLTAALLAKNGFTADARALEAPRGLLQVISDVVKWSELTNEIGRRFEISFNSFKPFACGIVIHPSIDACVQLRSKGIRAEDVEKIELKVNPLVLELTGKREPQDGLQAKFSVFHSAAVGLMFGKASEAEYADGIVTQVEVVQLRRKIVAVVDSNIDEDGVSATAFLIDGRQIRIDVKNAVGSLENPMSDTALEEKFYELTNPVVGHAKAVKLIEMSLHLNDLTDLADLTNVASQYVTGT